MLDVMRSNYNTYPLPPNINMYKNIASMQAKSGASTYDRDPFESQILVKAATILGVSSSTELIDVDELAEDNPEPLVQYVEIADSAGALYCVDSNISVACWLKVITIAKDCQSCNVLLVSTEDGVMLKTTKLIIPGEPLLMWFTDNISAMMNLPYLTSLHIKGENRYLCHICDRHYEYPNPLKFHVALDCGKLEVQHLWNRLISEFSTTGGQPNTANTVQNVPFTFELTSSPRVSPNRVSPNRVSPVSSNRVSPISTSPISPVLMETQTYHCTSANVSLNDSANYSLTSLNSSTLTSNSSFNRSSSPSLDSCPPSSFSLNSHTAFSSLISPASFSVMSSPGRKSYYCSSSSRSRMSPMKRNSEQRHSAFRPYTTSKPTVVTVTPTHHSPPETPILSAYHVPPAPIPAPTRPDVQAARMETIVSNLGKSRQGHLCIYCGKVYSRKYGLKIHIRTHTGYKPLKCKYCLRAFGDPSNLNKHVRLHSDGATPYRCDLCGKVLVRRRDLERHLKSRHQHNSDHISEDLSSDDMDI